MRIDGLSWSLTPSQCTQEDRQAQWVLRNLHLQGLTRRALAFGLDRKLLSLNPRSYHACPVCSLSKFTWLYSYTFFNRPAWRVSIKWDTETDTQLITKYRIHTCWAKVTCADIKRPWLAPTDLVVSSWRSDYTLFHFQLLANKLFSLCRMRLLIQVSWQNSFLW